MGVGPEARVAMPNIIEALGARLKSKVPIYNHEGGGLEFGGYLIYTVQSLDPETKQVFAQVRPNSSPTYQNQGSPAEWQKVYDALKKKYPEPPPQTALEPFKGPLPYVDGPLYLGKPASFWLNQLQDSAPQFRLEAVEALGNLARKNKELVPVLVSLLTDDGGVSRDKETHIVGSVASTILSSFGPDVLPVLLERVDRASPTALRRAAGIVGGFGPKGAPAVPLLTQELIANDPYHRNSIMIALARIGPEAKPAIPAMVDLLGHELESKDTLETLENLAVAEREFKDKLAAVEKEFKKVVGKKYGSGGRFGGDFDPPSPTLPVIIVTHLLSIDPEIKSILPAGMYDVEIPAGRFFEGAGFGGNAGKVGAAERSLVNLSAPVALWRQTYDALRKRYPTQPTTEPSAKRPAMGTVGDAADKKSAAPSAEAPGADVPNPKGKTDSFYQGKPASYWLEQLRDGDPKFRAEAVKAISGFARSNSALIPTLVAALRDSSSSVGYQASLALREAGPAAYPAIIEVLKDKNAGDARDRMIGALLLNPSQTPLDRDGIAFLLERKNPAGAVNPAPVPLLTETLQIDDRVIRTRSTIGLAVQSEQARAAVPALVRALGMALKTLEAAAKSGQIDSDDWLLAHLLFTAIHRIEPATHGIFSPNLRENSIPTDFAGKTLPVYRQVYERLIRDFPLQRTAPAATPSPKGVLETAPMPKQVPDESGPRYLGKSADYWLKQLEDGSSKFRLEALEALGIIGGKSKELVPVLVSSLKDDANVSLESRNYNLGEVAAKVLASLGPDVLPLVLDRVDRKSPVAMRHFADIIFWLGPKGAAAVPLLTQTLQTDDWGVRRSVTRALAAVAADAKSAIPAIVDCLGLALENEDIILSIKDAERFAKMLNDSAFGKKGKGGFPRGRDAAPVPVTILGDLLQIEPAIKGLLPKGMLRGDYPVYDAVSVSLWRQAHYAITERYPTERSKAAAAASSDPGAKDAGPRYLGKSATYWLKNLEDASPKGRLLALEALGNIAEKDKSMIPTVVASLQDKDFDVAAAAFEALRALGPDAIPDLLKHVDQTSPQATRFAAFAVSAVGSKGKAAAPMLMKALHMDDWPVRRAATEALAAIGPDAKPAIPMIVEVLGRVLEFKEVAEQLERDAIKVGKVGGGVNPKFKGQNPGSGVVVKSGGTLPLPVHFLDQLLLIDPDIKDALPEGILNAGPVRTWSGINLTATLALWRQTHEALQKKYPNP